HRMTVEAIARELDITHIKAEFLPDERAQEVARLGEAGQRVAVIGRAHEDEGALASADIPIILGGAGRRDSERGIALATSDLFDASSALAIAKATSRAAWQGALLATG